MSETNEAMRLRALAHPIRWKLIDVLGSELSATATRCAEVTGESVASCSYHLGILAKYGYIELVPDQPGREKPWRLTSTRQELSAEAAIEVFLDHELGRIKDRLRRRDLEPPEWRATWLITGSSMWVTAAELSEIKQELIGIANRYTDRESDPASRPEGARESRVFAHTSVAPEVPGRAS